MNWTLRARTTRLLAVGALLLAAPSSAWAGTLNRQAIVNYAYTYANVNNPNYRAFGNDCQNFVSQALVAGGWTYVNRLSPLPYAWWYTSIPTYFGYSLSWSVAHDFFWFTFRSGRAGLTNDPSTLMPGDILQVDWEGDGYVDHSMIVTMKDSAKTVYLTYHSGWHGPVVNKPVWVLKYSPNDPQLIIYPKIRFYGWRLNQYF